MHVHKLVCHIGHGSLYKEKHAPPVHVQMGSAAHSDCVSYSHSTVQESMSSPTLSSKVSSVRS